MAARPGFANSARLARGLRFLQQTGFGNGIASEKLTLLPLSARRERASD
jgi:hypothetical protein